jgi:hypothetical protein
MSTSVDHSAVVVCVDGSPASDTAVRRVTRAEPARVPVLSPGYHSVARRSS